MANSVTENVRECQNVGRVMMYHTILVPLDGSAFSERALPIATTLGRWLQVLAGPVRLLIFHLLMEGVQCNCELGEALGLPPNLISHHLRALRNAGLVDAERDFLDARWVYYSINRQALDQMIQAFRAFFDPQRIKPRRLTCGPHSELVPGHEYSILER